MTARIHDQPAIRANAKVAGLTSRGLDDDSGTGAYGVRLWLRSAGAKRRGACCDKQHQKIFHRGFSKKGKVLRLRGAQIRRVGRMDSDPLAIDKNVTQKRAVQDIDVSVARPRQGRTNGHGHRFSTDSGLLID